MWFMVLFYTQPLALAQAGWETPHWRDVGGEPHAQEALTSRKGHIVSSE